MAGVLIFGYPVSELVITEHATRYLLTATDRAIPRPSPRIDVKMINYALLRQKKIHWKTFRHDPNIRDKRMDFTATIDDIVHNKTARPVVISDPLLGIVLPEWMRVLRRRNMKALCILALRNPWTVAPHNLNSWVEYHRLAHIGVVRTGCEQHAL